MAIVKGIREKVHLPIYDSIRVEPKEQLRKVEASSTLKFFVNVQNKTKLETNLQSASLLPHYNTFEARAMRVVISDLPPEFPDDDKAPAVEDDGFEVVGLDASDNEQAVTISAATSAGTIALAGGAGTVPVTANIELTLGRVMELLRQARDSVDKEAELPLDDDDVTFSAGDYDLNDDQSDSVVNLGEPLVFSVSELEDYVRDSEQIPEREQPPLEQIRLNDGAGSVMGKLIFNTVTTFYVGEKVMIEMPTWNFPGGAGAWSFGAKSLSHGEPSPLATFRFAEPIYIDRQQNFRVEMEIPDADTLKEVQRIYGPLFIWVVLDGYMTRGVQ